MKLYDIYKLAVRAGINADIRGIERVKEVIEEARETFKGFSQDEKEYSKETLLNPYADTRILYGNPDTEIKGRILVGIDLWSEEVLLAEWLNRTRNANIDLILTHHPEGKAFSMLYSVLNMHSDILHNLGVPINIAESIVEARVSELEKSLMPLNVQRDVDAARALMIPYMCCHTPADNAVTIFLTDMFDREKPRNLQEIIDMLKEIPEYKLATKAHMPPRIIAGELSTSAGKIFVDMTGGTEGSPEYYTYLSKQGVGTIVTMHLSDKMRDAAIKNHMGVVIAGHIASDSLGMNLILDAICQEQRFEFICCSGFTRVDRTEGHPVIIPNPHLESNSEST